MKENDRKLKKIQEIERKFEKMKENGKMKENDRNFERKWKKM